MMNKYLLDDRSGTAGKTWRMSPPSHLRAAAVAVAVVLGAFGSLEAQALSLGRVTVLSALGEPLRAEIEIPQITAEEAASLKTGIPNPAAFRAAGVEYNPALAGAAITLHQRPDGRSYLRLVSDKTVSEPFVDLILEAQWSSGRLVRDYTLLFDPPSMRSPAPLAAGAPQVSTPLADSPTPGPQTPRGTPAPAAARVAAPAKPSRPQPERTIAAAPAKGLDAGGKTLKVQAGDTAGRLAAANKPTEVSLDQMLVALLRTNPDAFINGNINRIKAGALIEIPTAEQASNVPAGEARQFLSVKSANFNEFRRRLADAAPAQQVSAVDRQASGRVQPNIEERKTATASPDKLTLSKGSVKGAAPEAQIAQARQGKEEKERVAELSKNISELSRLQDKA
ncbi:MAG: fimbrial protein FimV, partial [Burkholderiaceae bacterium]|nr:fimbrial protein FimV [Burkholderiaceae bacterium]